MYKRKLSIVGFIILLCVMTCTIGGAGETQVFVDSLNTNWCTTNNVGFKETFNTRLGVHSNDLAALVVKADFYTSIELNLSTAQALVAVMKSTTSNLDWSIDKEAEAVCKEMIRSLEYPSEAQSAGYILGLSSNQIEELHSEFPSAHPLSDFLLRLGTIQYGSP